MCESLQFLIQHQSERTATLGKRRCERPKEDGDGGADHLVDVAPDRTGLLAATRNMRILKCFVGSWLHVQPACGSER